MDELQQSNIQLTDQNTILKAQVSAGALQVNNVNESEVGSVFVLHARTSLICLFQRQSASVHENNDALLERIHKLEADNARLVKVEEELAEKTSELEK